MKIADSEVMLEAVRQANLILFASTMGDTYFENDVPAMAKLRKILQDPAIVAIVKHYRPYPLPTQGESP